MELVFLIALLFVVIWLNRNRLGFGSTGCSWMKADNPSEDGSWKLMCNTCGAVTTTPDGKPPEACHKQ